MNDTILYRITNFQIQSESTKKRGGGERSEFENLWKLNPTRLKAIRSSKFEFDSSDMLFNNTDSSRDRERKKDNKEEDNNVVILVGESGKMRATIYSVCLFCGGRRWLFQSLPKWPHLKMTALIVCR